ncbi:hypothetical protein CFE70_002839 [Pyrenophora teres f. teres 0-1]|uniref:Uncharacterized protein n=1 Tax=Pyrenophora teres f. teres (strain 0-1) TaxID=861557 RepID=E3S050_PYRTT|nr:hypothetical protein PTT_15397 [Pyrenophora teres f. teres 0-1]
MRFELSTLVALSTLGSVANAANLYTYFGSGCGGCGGGYFQDLKPQTCALTWPRWLTTNATEAIQRKLTTINSAKLQVWIPENKVMQMWAPSKNATDDNGLPLQCGDQIKTKDIDYFETCLSEESTGVSWYKPDPNHVKRSDDVVRCKEQAELSGVFTKDNQHFSFSNMKQQDKEELLRIVSKNEKVPAKFDSYKVAAPPVKAAN